MFGETLGAIPDLTWGAVAMMAIALLLVYLGLARKYEPLLLLPIGLGVLLANLPATGIAEDDGFLGILRKVGLDNELFPLLMFLGVGALTDFTPLIQNPTTVLLGAAAQFGIFAAIMAALLLGWDLNNAGAIGIIGSADGPTTIFVSTQLADPDLWGPIAVAAYSYMALVPLIQPPIMRLLTTSRERQGQDAVSLPRRLLQGPDPLPHHRDHPGQSGGAEGCTTGGNAHVRQHPERGPEWWSDWPAPPRTSLSTSPPYSSGSPSAPP